MICRPRSCIRGLTGLGILIALTCRGSAQISRFPYEENFDSTAQGILPPGWQSAGFSASSTSPHSPPYCLSATGNTSPKSCTTPVFDFTSRFPEVITFFERRSQTALGYRLEIRASTDGATFPILLARFDTVGTTSSYIVRNVSLVGKGLENMPSVRVRWQILADSTNSTGVLRLDDVSLRVAARFDLSVVSLAMRPQFPGRKDSITLTANIRNIGRELAAEYSVELLINAGADASLTFAQRLASVPGPDLEAGDSTMIAIVVAPRPAGIWKLFARIVWPSDEQLSNDTLSTVVQVGRARGDMMVNEVMYAPQGDEPEWVEVWNAADDTVDIRNWRISDSNTSLRTLVTTSPTPVIPGGYAVIAREAGFSAFHPSVPVLVSAFSALNNTTPDAVVLYDGRGCVMDSMWYAPAWGGQGGRSLERIDGSSASTDAANWSTCTDSSGSTPGRINSTARMDNDLLMKRAWADDATSTADGSFTVRSVVMNAGRKSAPRFTLELFLAASDSIIPDEGVPRASVESSAPLAPLDSVEFALLLDSLASGRADCLLRIRYEPDQRPSNNSVRFNLAKSFAAASVIINEIMYDPRPGQSEWAELFNRTAEPVDLASWVFSDSPTSSGASTISRFPRTPTVVQPAGYAVIAADSTILDAFPSLRGATYPVVMMNSSSGLGLNNDGDAVILRDLTGRTIDSVAYSPQWHHPAVAETKGRSLERINPNLASNDARSWSTATAPAGGSPGMPNSVLSHGSSDGGTLSISPNPFSPDGDSYEDFCVIRFRLPFHSCVMNIRIFDLRGRLVRWLSNAEFVGADGDVIWDGLDDRRQRVRLGAYVVLLQATHQPGGEVTTMKALVAVATKR